MNEPLPEFSRVVSVTRIPPKGSEENIEAKPAEKEALARRFALLDLPLLKAGLTLVPDVKQAVSVKGLIEAEVVQSCVVTLEPVESSLKIPVDSVLVPTENASSDPQEIVFDDNSDTYENGRIDIGELVSQYLGVNLDPYPRKKGAQLGAAEFGKKPEKLKPFAKLAAALKSKKNKDKR